MLLPFAQIERPLTLAVDNAPTRLSQLGGQLLAVIIFSLVGVVVFVGCLYLIERLTPFSIHREIIDEHNTSVGIVVGSIIIGMPMIIASAVMG